MSRNNINDCYKCFPGGLSGRRVIEDNTHLCDHHLRVVALDRLDFVVRLLEKIEDGEQIGFDRDPGTSD